MQKLVEQVFEKYQEVKLVYLFGSTARDDCGPLSDYDFAVFLGEKDKKEIARIHFQLMDEISRTLGTDKVDIVILDSAESPELKYNILQEGKLIFEREPYRVLVEPKILNEYFDFHLALKRHGLTRARDNMTSINVIENKVSTIRKYLSILDRYEGFTRDEIEANVDIRGAVERYLYLASQSTIDLAEIIIAYKKLRKPATMAESFHILREAGVISGELMKRLVQLTGFRNVIAHAYEDLDYDIVFNVLHGGKQDIIAFIEAVDSSI